MPKPLHPQGGARSIVGTAALLAVPVLCCAGPALLGAAALGTVGASLLSPWLLGAAGLVALGVLRWQLRHRASSSARAGCCPPEPYRRARTVDPARLIDPAATVETHKPPIQHQER